MSTRPQDIFVATPWRHRAEAGDGVPWGFLGTREGHLLFHLARDYFSAAGVIVDAGAFLGCSAWYFATGLSRNRTIDAAPRPLVQCFDNFIVNDSLTTEAIEREFGEHLEIGQSTRHLFEKQTKDVAGWLDVHAGDFHTYAWAARPIEILLVDIAKSVSLNRRVIEVFYPHLLPGRSIVVHQDYHHPWLPHIHVSMELLHAYFELVEPKVDDSAAFRLVSAIPADVLASAATAHALPVARQLDLMDSAIERLPKDCRRHVQLARANYLGTAMGYEAMRAALAAIDAEQPPTDSKDPHWAGYRGDMHRMLAGMQSDLHRGWLLVQAGDLDGAMAIADHVPASDARFAEALVLRSHCLRRLRRPDDAQQSAERALRVDPNYTPAWVERAWVALEAGDLQGAVDAAQRGIACAVGDTHLAFSHHVLGLALSRLGHHEDAVRAGQMAIAKEPTNPWFLVHHAQCLNRAGRPDDAAQAAARALTLDPANAQARAILDGAPPPS